MKQFEEQLKRLRTKKIEQTKEKIAKEGLLDEDDYGRVVPPEGIWQPRPNHPDGSFYGFDAWADNFCRLMEVHPTYVDPDDAFMGRWMYFMSKMRKNKWNPAYPYETLKADIETYNIICGIGDDAHFAPDFAIGLELGWMGLIEKIEHYKKIHQTEEQTRFYDLHIRAIQSILGWMQRHIDAANQLLTAETDPTRSQNLREMIATCSHLMTQPPTTLRQACQWIIWYHLASRTYNRDGAGGQLDVLLQPFYEKDLAEGLVDRPTAVYYMACLLLNDPVYWQVGGPDADGNDQTCELSYILLDGASKIDSSINITVRVHDGLPEPLLRQSVECLITYKNGWPRFSGNKALVQGFMKNGFSAGLARRRIAVGCNWMSLPGLEYTMNDLVKVNMAKVFEVAFRELMTGKVEPSLQELWHLFEAHLTKAVAVAAAGIQHHLQYQKYNEPELLLNLLSHGPIEKGVDVVDGGACFYNLAIDGAGLAVVADSFAAIQQRVVDEKSTTWCELDAHLSGNFEGEEGERYRRFLKASERFGQPDSLGERWAIQTVELFSQLVRSHSNEDKKHIYIPGLFSWANTVAFGNSVGATPDGRKAYTPISHGANPSPGFETNGASLSLATSIARVQPGYGNTAPMQWELDPFLATKDHVETIMAIIKTHFDMGGTLINANVVDKKTILEAHEDPTRFPELVVRITGFTAYFSMLSPQFRQLVVDRILED